MVEASHRALSAAAAGPAIHHLAMREGQWRVDGPPAKSQ